MLSEDHLMEYSTNGTVFERVMRGAFLGLALGVALGVIMCCWVPCCRHGGWFTRGGRDVRRARRREAGGEDGEAEGERRNGVTI